MNQRNIFKLLSLAGVVLGGIGTLLSGWADNKEQEAIIEEKVNEALAARNGIRVSYICAVNTSRLAFDGSGKVIRGKDAGFNTYELCKFTTGKVYNCDLSASKNIGARFFIRVLLKSLSAKEELLVLAKVPELNRRTNCCLATLINAYAVLCASKAKPESPAEGDAARQSH